MIFDGMIRTLYPLRLCGTYLIKFTGLLREFQKLYVSEGANRMRMTPITIVSILCLFFGDSTYAQAPFYQDKTITVVLVGGPPAGSADLRTRGVINILRKHIPGNPTIVMQYMGAGGGRQAANHIYGVAKPDGLTVGSMGAALVTNAVLGATGVQYDIDKLIYLGTPDSAQHYLFITHRHAGLDTLEKLRAASGVRIGGQSVGHPVYITGRAFRLSARIEGAQVRRRFHRPGNRCSHRAEAKRTRG